VPKIPEERNIRPVNV